MVSNVKGALGASRQAAENSYTDACYQRDGLSSTGLKGKVASMNPQRNVTAIG